jgi:hypothetical protein
MTIPECLEVFKTFSCDVFGQANQSGTLSRLFGAVVGKPFFEANNLEIAVKNLLMSKGYDENIPLRDTNDSPCNV